MRALTSLQVHTSAEQDTARSARLDVQVAGVLAIDRRLHADPRSCSTSGAVEAGGFDEQVKKMEDEFNAVSQDFLRGNLHAFRSLL